jgi:DNA-binding transcriptional LysR family regulator
LRIGCGTFSVSQYLPRVAACFQQSSPEVDLLIRIERGRERVLGTAEGRFDLSIVTHSPKQIRETLKDNGHAAGALKIEDLCHHPLAVIAQRDSETGRELDAYDVNRPLPIAALRKWELVGLDRDSGVRQQLEAACHPLGELYFSVEGGGWAAAREYARLKMGAAILPEALLIPDDRQTFVVRNLGKDFVLTDRVISRKDQKSPAVKDALKVLKQEANG